MTNNEWFLDLEHLKQSVTFIDIGDVTYRRDLNVMKGEDGQSRAFIEWYKKAKENGELYWEKCHEPSPLP